MPDSNPFYGHTGKGSPVLHGNPAGVAVRKPVRAGRRPAGIVRPLEERDLARVGQLYERGTPVANPLPGASLEKQLSRLLLHYPGSKETVCSLVFEGRDGSLGGCMGVMPRPMLFHEKPVTAAVSHSFVVAPGSSPGAAVELARAFLAGPQDLSLAEGGGMSRRIWEQVGGCTTLLYSLRWTRPLQPGRCVLALMRRRGLSPMVGRQLRPVFRATGDRAWTAGFPEGPPVIASELAPGTLCRAMDELTRDRPLRPRYDEYSCAWLLETLARKRGRGTLRKIALHNRRREVVGWYVYYGAPGEIGTAVQIGTKAGWAGSVLGHLFHDAGRRGLIAVSGQADPALFHQLAGENCFFHHEGGSWELLHSRDKRLMRSVHRGEAFLSRSEGEWWISSLLN